MKKAIFVFSLFALPFAAIAQDNNDTEKTKIITECVDKLAATLGSDEEMTTIFKDFCTCQTENMLKEFSIKEIKDFETAMETATEEQQMEMASKFMPLIMPCMEDLQKKLGM